MATGVQVWSTTAASNNTIDSNVNAAEGQAPSSLNDANRAQMASVAKWRDDNSGTLSTTGSTAAFTVTSNQVSTGNTDGYTVAVKFHGAADADATLAVDGATAAQLQAIAGTNLAGGEFSAGTIARFTYTSASTAWVLNGVGLSTTANIADSAVTYAKIQDETDNTLLGNVSGGAAAPQEIVIGKGLSVLSSSTLTAPAFPPTSSFKNLSIKVASNTTVTGAADFATLATSGSSNFVTVPLTGTINLGTAGAVNALDTGTIAANTVYAVWGIAASSTSTAGGWLASTSFTTPEMPSGYTVKARLGAVITSTGAAQLFGTWQLGRWAQYKVGLAQTTALPAIASGTAGTYSTTAPTWVAADTSSFVPATASRIQIIVTGRYKAGGSAAVQMHPNNGAEGYLNASGIVPIFDNGGLVTVPMAPVTCTLESTNVYWASNAAGGGLVCVGWEDNI